MMSIGDLYVDPADNMIMMYMGGHPIHRGRHRFYCPTAGGGSKGDNIFYYDQHDLQYLEKVDVKSG